MKWCNPCALLWVTVISATLTKWMNVAGADYFITAAIVLVPLIVVYAREERESLWWFAQNLIADAWWLMKNRHPKNAAPQAGKPVRTGNMEPLPAVAASESESSVAREAKGDPR